MYPTSLISINFTDLLEQPEYFKSILEHLVKICEKEIAEQEKIANKPKPVRRKKKVDLEVVNEK